MGQSFNTDSNTQPSGKGGTNSATSGQPQMGLPNRNIPQTYNNTLNGGWDNAQFGNQSSGGKGKGVNQQSMYAPVPQDQTAQQNTQFNQQSMQYGGNTPYSDPNPGWTNSSDAQKASWYQQNPFASSVTQFGQTLFGLTTPGFLQNQFNPGFTDAQRSIAMGITPDGGGTTAAMQGGFGDGTYGGYTSQFGQDNGTSDAMNGGFGGGTSA